MNKIQEIQKIVGAVSHVNVCGGLLHIYRHGYIVPFEKIIISNIRNITIFPDLEDKTKLYQSYTAIFQFKEGENLKVNFPTGYDTFSWQTETETILRTMLIREELQYK